MPWGIGGSAGAPCGSSRPRPDRRRGDSNATCRRSTAAIPDYCVRLWLWHTGEGIGGSHRRTPGARERQGRAMTDLARIEIVYCRQCRWLLRAAWMAQELLSTFETELGGIALVPGTGGIFEVRLGADVIWSRQEMERFPDIKELKQLVRDRVAPEKDLGHAEPDGAKS